MKKAILQVCAYAAPYEGNFIVSLKALAIENSKDGYETIFAFPETAQERDWCKELSKEFTVYFLPLKSARCLPATYKKMKEIYKRHNIVIAHSHFELYDIPVTVMAPKSTKIFWHLHDALDLIYSKSNRIYRIIWKLQYSIFSKRAILLSVSEKGKRFAIKLGFNKDNTYFVPNAIDNLRLDNCSDELENRYDFLIFGWDYKRKGVDILIDAIPKIKTNEYSCAVVSGGGDLATKNVPHLIDQRPVENVGALYNSTKCFLHISRHEGLSYALLEAIYCGCIVICSDIEQNMFAKDFPSVIIIKVEDSDQLAETMDGILDGSISITNEMICESKKMIMDNYSISSWVNEIKRYYFS